MAVRGIEFWTQLPSAAFDTCEAAVGGWSGYVSGLCRRRADIIDVATDFAEFWGAVTSRECPQWTHRNDIVGQWPLADLRDFSPGISSTPTPTLVVPPQSGRASTIVDAAEDRSLVGTLLDAGAVSLYCIDWNEATDATAQLSIEDYALLLEEMIRQLGGRVNLVGYSQGGWLATIIAALHPSMVGSLVLIGAPIDFHAGRPLVGDWIKASPAGRDSETLRSIVAATWEWQREIGEAFGAPMGRPAGDFERAMRLLGHIDDAEYVNRYREAKKWFEWKQAVPVAFATWMIEQLFVSNRLISGDLVIGSRSVELSAITSPLFLIAGSADRIAPPQQLWALERAVSTPSAQITRKLAKAGHLGLIIDQGVLHEQCLPVFRAMVAISTVGAS
ncbi:hypothetical protein B2J88_18560 [Rhodococcus sp. SRB_17]|nr:hypothetical protein [Rhodococcus sp. SRB_17]